MDHKQVSQASELGNKPCCLSYTLIIFWHPTAGMLAESKECRAAYPLRQPFANGKRCRRSFCKTDDDDDRSELFATKKPRSSTIPRVCGFCGEAGKGKS
jgi:hypothetical protein